MARLRLILRGGSCGLILAIEDNLAQGVLTLRGDDASDDIVVVSVTLNLGRPDAEVFSGLKVLHDWRSGHFAGVGKEIDDVEIIFHKRIPLSQNLKEKRARRNLGIIIAFLPKQVNGYLRGIVI